MWVCLTYNIQLISASSQLSNVLYLRLLFINVKTKCRTHSVIVSYVCDQWSGPDVATLLKGIFVLNQQEATGGNVIMIIYIKCTVLRVTRAE